MEKTQPAAWSDRGMDRRYFKTGSRPARAEIDGVTAVPPFSSEIYGPALRPHFTNVTSPK
jgi:hypothetical protein